LRRQPVDELTVVSWNTQGRGPERLRLAEAMDAWRPDILLLQEADGDHLGEALPPAFTSRVWWPRAGFSPGLVIASRLTLEDQGLLEPVNPPWDRPRVAWARLRLDGASLTVASTHLMTPLPPDSRARRDAQFRALSAWAEGLVSATDRLVVAGDFNTRNPTMPGMTDASSAAPSPTWRPLATSWLRPILRLDAIFVGPGLRVHDAFVDDRYRGSDHLPVIARIAVASTATDHNVT
jgi:endonuclease/exonuclease/phosphatase family metal-dependent hydrolase